MGSSRYPWLHSCIIMGGDGGFGKGGKGEKKWVPLTKLGRLVKAGKITSMNEIYTHSLPVKEYQIIDQFFPDPMLKDDVMKIMPVQKQTSAGQRNRFKAFVAVGDSNGHLGLGVKSSKEVATAIRGGLIYAKLSLVPIRRGWWGNKIGAAHTVPMKVTGKCGSVRVRLIPAPRGTGIVGAPTSKKLLQFAGISDCFTCTSGHSKTKGNFMKACFDALKKTYGYLTPDLWSKDPKSENPYKEHSHFLATAMEKKEEYKEEQY